MTDIAKLPAPLLINVPPTPSNDENPCFSCPPWSSLNSVAPNECLSASCS